MFFRTNTQIQTQDNVATEFPLLLVVYTQMHSLNLAAVVGFLQVLVQFDHPFLILLLLNASHLLQLTGPLVLQDLFKDD